MEENLKKIIDTMISDEDVKEYRKELCSTPFNLMEAFFEGFISNLEGSCCSVDKADYVAKCVLKYVETGVDFSLRRTYLEQNPSYVEERGMPANKIPFWCPLSFNMASEAWAAFDAAISFNNKWLLAEIEKCNNRIKTNR